MQQMIDIMKENSLGPSSKPQQLHFDQILDHKAHIPCKEKSIEKDCSLHENSIVYTLDHLIETFKSNTPRCYMAKSKAEPDECNYKYGTELLSCFSEKGCFASDDRHISAQLLGVHEIIEAAYTVWEKIKKHPHFIQFKLADREEYRTLISRLGHFGNYSTSYYQNLQTLLIKFPQWIKNESDLPEDKYLIWQPLVFYFIRYSRGIDFEDADFRNILGSMYSNFCFLKPIMFIELLKRLEFCFINFLLDDLNWMSYWGDSRWECPEIQNMNDLFSVLKQEFSVNEERK